MNIDVQVQASRGFVWFLIGFLALVTVFCILGGLQQHGSDGWGLIVFAIVLAFITQRVARYYLKPQISVTDTHLVIWPFWKPTVKWPFEGTSNWQTTTQLIEKDWRSRRLIRPITVERLSRTDATGKTTTIVLPGFAGHNQKILDAIADRSGVAVLHRSTKS